MKMVDLEHDDDFTSVAYKTNTNFKQMSWQFKKLLDKAIKELREFLLIVVDKTKQELTDLNEQTQEESYTELFVTIDKVRRDYTDLIEQTQEESYTELFVAIDKVRRDYMDLIEQVKIMLTDYIDQIKDELEDLVEQTKQELQDMINQAKDELEDMIDEVRDQIESLKIPVGSYSVGYHPNYPNSNWTHSGYIEIVNGSTTTSVSAYERTR